MEQMSSASGLRLDMRDIEQRFGETTVLHGVSLQVKAGKVHALVGQNGAGKSTLMKILGGIHTNYSGTIRIDNKPVSIGSPREAARHGIGMIYQELSLIRTLSVAENVMLGMEPGRIGYRRRDVIARAREVVAGIPMLEQLPLSAPAGSLSTGLQQRVEIAKAISRNARVLVMDEPTARLSGPERADLHELIAQLARDKITVIYISHFLDEVLEVCDSLTVLRNGREVGRGPASDFSVASLTRAMLNEELEREEMVDCRPDRALSDEVVLEAQGIGGSRIHGIDMQLRRGEVIGLAGLVGSGRTRLGKSLVGAEPITSGILLSRGVPARFRSPRDAMKRGVVLLSENRKVDGIIGALSARFNMSGMALDRGMATGGIINRTARSRLTRQYFADLTIRPNAPSLAGHAFSGGNQQKILLARALLARPEVVVADQPTAGVDVGTKAQIHRLIKDRAAEGMSFVIASDDLDELIALSDTVLVMRRGRVIARRRRSELNRQALVDLISHQDDPPPVGLEANALSPSQATGI